MSATPLRSHSAARSAVPAAVRRDVQVVAREWVPPLAHPRSRHLRSGAFAPCKIDRSRNWLKVLRINARTNAAEMVEVETGRDRTDKSFVHQTMCWHAAPFDVSPAVSTGIQAALPDPTGSFVSTVLNEVVNWGRASLMPSQKSQMPTRILSFLVAGELRNRRRGSAATLTQSRGVGVWKRGADCVTSCLVVARLATNAVRGLAAINAGVSLTGHLALLTLGVAPGMLRASPGISVARNSTKTLETTPFLRSVAA